MTNRERTEKGGPLAESSYVKGVLPLSFVIAAVFFPSTTPLLLLLKEAPGVSTYYNKHINLFSKSYKVNIIYGV